MRIQDIGTELQRIFLRGSAAQRHRLALKFERTLNDGGIHRALEFLNARVPHRYTSVCRFDPPMLRGVFAFDRARAHLLLGDRTQALDETYAGIVQRRKQQFVTENAQRDSRLVFHPARTTIASYAGVPIRLPSGELWGVLAHHDSVPRRLSDTEVDLLREIVPLIARWLRPDTLDDRSAAD